ncbi:hypothetical protein BC629DRAFT_313977 [Irpex lacteus]|nr:hypothetical protein BC629DRAFT_313977 [Irpex lacteus]
MSSCLLPVDIWYQICGHSTLKTLHMLRETSKEMQNIVDSRSVWVPFMIKFTKARPSAYSVDDFEEMSAAQLREAAARMVLVDRAYASPTLPHRPILLFSGQEVDNFSTVVLFPGGERLLIVRDDGTLQIYDIASKTFISHSAKPLRGDGLGPHQFKPHVRFCSTSVRSGFLVADLIAFE